MNDHLCSRRFTPTCTPMIMIDTLHPYLIPLKKHFEAKADVENASKMRAYMKDQFVFYGIKATERRELMKDHRKNEGIPTTEDIPLIVADAWNLAHREYQYFALDLLARNIEDMPKTTIKLVEKCMVKKSWWDTVDMLAIHCAGPLMKGDTELSAKVNEKWIGSKNKWLNRAALIFQIKYKEDTDQALLFENIEKMCDHDDFFTRKAIGWALREHGKTFPAAVKKFVKETPHLSELSKREALRNL